jgi:hypothetical protein
VKKLPPPSAKLVGRANPGLEFFHVELPPPTSQGLLITKNMGIVYVEAGEINKEDLATEFSVIYKTTWPWKIRALDDWTYLVKFPPHMSVADVASYPCFGLVKQGVTINVEVWDGELEYEENTHDVGLQLRGINPKWCKWGPLAQFTLVFGILTDVDWCSTFKSLGEVVIVKIQCKDPALVPKEWFFKMEKKFYKIGIVTELSDESAEKGEDLQDPSDPDGDQGSRKTNIETKQENASKKQTMDHNLVAKTLPLNHQTTILPSTGKQMLISKVPHFLALKFLCLMPFLHI